ncbi:MAG: 23S rRNA pseudouridine(955/2504/2580) synthase RluC [Candidatus Dasytiphilus stammeri]
MKINLTDLQSIVITPDEIGRRLDNFLRSQFKKIPKSLFYRLLRKGNIRVNQRSVNPAYKLKLGDKVYFPLSSSVKNKAPVVSTRLVNQIATAVLYEDDYILAINKPSGLAVHGGSGLSFGVIEGLRILLPDCSFLELVHRLDRDTSGILLIAKKRSVLRILHEQFRLQKVKKYYLALVCGVWSSEIKIVHVPLLKNVMKNGERIVCVSDQGKISKTYFKIEEQFSQTTLMRVSPVTGRTHQIRVHAKYAGHPIVFDERYGDKEFNSKIAKLGLKRLFLHASVMIFNHPNSHEKICLTAPLHDELKQCLLDLRQNNISNKTTQ